MTQSIRNPAGRKAEIRRACLGRRLDMDAAVAAEHSRSIVNRLAGLDLLSDAGCVHAFWPIHEKREVDLRPLLRRWAAEGRTVVLPVVRYADPGVPPELEHRRFTDEQRLVTSSWGIAEPLEDELIDPGEIDAVLVPALAVARDGTRLGYGMGFYDRFLSHVDAIRICPLYDGEVVSAVPREDHDEQVDIIVTERRTMTLRRT